MEGTYIFYYKAGKIQICLVNPHFVNDNASIDRYKSNVHLIDDREFRLTY
jgi:hypothetical protein